MNDWEKLSRWVDDDLSTGERAAMQARLRDDPLLEARAQRMRALVEDLGHLPEQPAPPALDARVLAKREPARWAPLALAALVLLTIGLWRPAPPRVELSHGVQVVDGQAWVEAPWVDVEVDGRVRIAVEPIEALGRERRPEGSMDRTHVLAALAGALVVVTVERGTAVLHPANADEIVVAAGETHVVRSGRSDGAPAPVPASPAPITPRPGETPLQTIARLQERVGQLEAELTTARQAGGIARGQLEVEQGAASPWPDDAPAELKPDAFEATVRAAVAKVGGAVVETVDCAEYPCIAVIRPLELTEDWPKRFKGLGDGLIPSLTDPSTSINVSRFGDGDKEAGLMAIAVGRKGELERGSPVNQRTDWRGQVIVEGLAEELLGAPNP
jgi:hypothetical protein